MFPHFTLKLKTLRSIHHLSHFTMSIIRQNKNTQKILKHVLFLLIFVSFSYSQSVTESSIHELLKSKGLPVGLFPKEVESFTLYDTGLLEVFLRGPCLTKFDTMAFYESTVRANLTYGSLTGVEGLSQEELFLWLPVKDIIVDDPKSGLILFDIGLAHKQLSLSLFEDPPDCKSEGVLDTKKKSRKEIGFDAQM